MEQIEILSLLKDRKQENYNKQIEAQIKANWDAIAKPLDSMGTFETLLSRVGAIQESVVPRLEKITLAVMCADNGIVEEGVSQSGQEVTAICAENIASYRSAVGTMANYHGVEVVAMDVGMNTKGSVAGVLTKKLRNGTRNFLKEAAMTEQEALYAMQVGLDFVCEKKRDGYDLVLVGEMGIGNTTSSSAVAAALLGCDVESATGRGAGLSDEGLQRKCKVIKEALKLHQLCGESKPQALYTLCCVGGFDIAALVGVCLGGAYFHMPILLDGVISMVAALTAEELLPGTKEYLIPSHLSKEPVAVQIRERLDLAPVLDAGMALGEGTGAVMMLGLLRTANEVYKSSSSFSKYGIEQYIRK